MNDRKNQVGKALKEIGYEHYYLAEEERWVLYLEGSTDLAILRAFARKLRYQDAEQVLEKPFAHYVGNRVSEVARHFFGLREAVPKLKGIVLFDRRQDNATVENGVEMLVWRRREIECYLCQRETLLNYANQIPNDSDTTGPLFGRMEKDRRSKAMEEAIGEMEAALHTLNRPSPWDPNLKVSDDFLTPLFENYFKKLGLPNVLEKKNFHELASFVPEQLIDAEIMEKLQAIVRVAQSVRQ
jgi:hypothetical protein